MLPDKTLDAAVKYIREVLVAHDGDIAEELTSSEDGKAQISFALTFKSIGNGKIATMIRARIPREAVTVETKLEDSQIKLPGV